MRSALLEKQLADVLGGHIGWQVRPAPETVRIGVPELDAVTGGIPRGCLTEIFGPASSGRASLLASILAEATHREEVCVLVDAEDCFDPLSAAMAGVRLERLLWIRCGHNAEYALKAVDLLIQGGGFGLVVLDLGGTPPETARRISLTSWFRLRRAVEKTPTVLVSVARQSNAKTCASLILECSREGVSWPGGVPLLRSMSIRVWRRKPGRVVAASYEAFAQEALAGRQGASGVAACSMLEAARSNLITGE